MTSFSGGSLLVIDFSRSFLRGQVSLICPVPVLKEEVMFRLIPHFGQKEEFFPPIRAYNEDICPLMHRLGHPKR